jgi:hypothetical protein
MVDENNICFVIMPFGVKPQPDGSGHSYDFDKIYRVIIRRAIKEAGMEPHRADEGVGSSLVHTDMFRDLRDRPVVLADISLENPNVFYELGIRHVMADSGTVLICRENADLPFDVGLSRVVFYKYDGVSLDWEEVERITPIVAAALQEARRGKPDSPVHALLPGSVTRSSDKRQHHRHVILGAAESDELAAYEQMVAERWLGSDLDANVLYEEHQSTVFGTRALGALCLHSRDLPESAAKIAAHLSDQEQYNLANRVFERIRAAGMAGWRDNLRFATSYSEANLTVDGVDVAMGYAEEALGAVKTEFPDEKLQTDAEALRAHGETLWRISGLQRWRYRLTESTHDLNNAVRSGEEALEHLRRARVLGGLRRPGRLAQAHLLCMLLLRMRDNDRMRPDQEGHQQAVLEIKEMQGDEPIELSWLHWYQALALADTQDKESAMQMAQRTLAQDAQLSANPEYWEVGRRQYVLLRRFIEQYSSYFRDPALLGAVSQVLQSVT